MMNIGYAIVGYLFLASLAVVIIAVNLVFHMGVAAVCILLVGLVTSLSLTPISLVVGTIIFYVVRGITQWNRT